jgi:hypothetical protein
MLEIYKKYSLHGLTVQGETRWENYYKTTLRKSFLFEINIVNWLKYACGFRPRACESNLHNFQSQ